MSRTRNRANCCWTVVNCCLQNKKPTPGPDQGTKTTSLSELCDREQESTSLVDQNALKRPCRQESRYRNKILLFKRSLLYLRALEFRALQTQLEWGPDCLRLRSPEMFICRLHLFRFILQSQYRLSSSVEQQLHLQQPTSETPIVSSLMNHTCFTISNSEHVFVERLCAITNATVTLQWRSRSVYAHWKKPTIFTVHCRPD